MPINVPIFNSNGGSSAAVDYVGLQSSTFFVSTTEADVETTYRTAGTFRNLSCYVQTNTSVLSSTVTFRKNSAAGNQTVTIGALATGWFEDTTNTDTVSAGDRVAILLTRGGTLTINLAGAYFSANGLAVNKVGATNAAGLSTASVTRFIGLVGDATLNTTETNGVKRIIKTTSTAKNLNITITTNARTTNSTIRFRKNAANGNQVITIGAGVTGVLEDTSNTDSLVDTDTVNYSLTTGTGSGSLQLSRLSVEIEYPNSTLQIFSGFSAGSSNVSTASRFGSAVGGLTQIGNDLATAIKFLGRGTIRAASINVVTNLSSVVTNYYVRKNQVDTALALTVAAGTNGAFNNDIDSFTFSDGDLLNWRSIKTDASNVSISRASFLIDYVTFKPMVIML